MGDLVNLRQARKRKQRDQKAKKADENRVLHGRTRHERTLSDARNRAAEKHLDGHNRAEPDAGEDNATDRASVSTAETNASQPDEQENVVSIFGNKKPDNDPA
jgi:hypothetical protein